MSGPTTDEVRAVADADGHRHALGLTVAFVAPFSALVVELADARLAAFPRALTFAVAVLTAVVAVLLTADGAVLGLRRAAARGFGVVLLALAVRFAAPSPPAAWASYRAGDEALVSGRLLVPLLLFLVALAAGQIVTLRVAAAIVGDRTAGADRARERTALQVWFATSGVLLLLAATPAARVPWVFATLVLGPPAALFVLADLRTRLRGPSNEPDVLRGGPRGVVRATAVGTLVAVLAVTVLAVVMLPPRAMQGQGRPSEWIADVAFDWEVRQRTGQRDGVVGAGQHRAQNDGGDGSGGQPADPTGLFEAVPNPPWWVLLAAAAVVTSMILRPRAWGRLLHRLATMLRGTGTADVTDDDVQRWQERAGRPREQRRLRDALQRFLPRPRDPRQAIVHDYLRVERALAREGADHPRARALSETPLEHADRISLGEAHAELAALASQARFARTAPTAADADRSLGLRQAVEQALREPTEGSGDQAPVA
ncbi:hypothetical protein [Egicoccus sp. AB-alg2]|uniref:hypothetical protein n=1 Tax=Egicoccus sp. AB-alg2 TaxID=3242693 RepID=UPI00359DAD2C